MTPLRTLFTASLCVASSIALAQVNNDNTPESQFVNTQYNAGLAAGNAADWYLNCDGNHASLNTSRFLTLNRYPDGSASSLQSSSRDLPRNILGNASLGVGGLWSITRYYAMSTFYGNNLYTQYRNNQHYFYPAVQDTQFGNARDLTFALYPYITQSVGKSGSELDEVRKFFLTMAAFHPDVKTVLQDEGLLIPTVQMIFRRTRVADDAEYLTGLAHPSAFANVSNELAMVQMANAITTADIPPLVQMTVVEENFLSSHPSNFNEAFTSSTGEHVFTSPLAIGRLWRGPEYTKRMVVDISGSFDVNDLDLTYDFVVLRGDPSKVRFTPLNAEGTLMAIEMDYQSTFIEEFTGEQSNMILIGVFANNGTYYSSPAFISCSTLWNESRIYGSDNELDTITYNATTINSNVAFDRSWNRDHFEWDPYGRVFKYNREFSTRIDGYTAEGYRILEEDSDGRPTKATRVSYSRSNNITAVADTYTDTSPYYEMLYNYVSQSIPTNGSYTYDFDSASDSPTILVQAKHGTVQIVYNQPDAPDFVYTPDTDFVGVDTFVVWENNYSLQDAPVVHKVRMIVGPADVTAPAQVQNVQVLPKSIGVARIIWDLPSDDYEVAYFEVYRDGGLLGKAYGLAYEDDTVTPGSTYDYTIIAYDDAGNASPVSVAVNGGGAAIYGQDNFDDQNIAVADGSLQNCLTWDLLSGNVVAGVPNLRPGRAATEYSYVVTDQSITPPFTMDFSVYQRYNADNNGPILLFQDLNNFYFFKLNRDFCELYRRMDGVDTLIGSDSNLRMQIHAGSTARYQITVVAVDGVVTFQVVRSEWTNSPDLVTEGFFYDHNAAAFNRFQGGPVGFQTQSTGSYNVATYDDLFLYRLDGQGPDIDGDGLIDAWERAFFGDYGASDANPGSDPDNDGVSTGDERLWGSNPATGNRNFEFGMNMGGSADATLTWPSLDGRVYTVWTSTNLIDWNEVPGLIDVAATPPMNSADVELPDGAGFFEIEVQAAP